MSDVTETVVRRTIELAEIPAPTGVEAARAALVRSWWELDGLRDVHVDEAGNVWAKARDGDGPIVIGGKGGTGTDGGGEGWMTGGVMVGTGGGSVRVF